MIQIIRWSLLAVLTLCVLSLSPQTLRAEYTADEKKLIEELKKSYPLTTCPVSGDALGGSMGAALDYLYKYKTANGQETTHLIRFCCKGCIKTFLKDPEKYLKVIDAASAKQTQPPQTTEKPRIH